MGDKQNQAAIDSKLEAIKDIIFGQEKADLEERLTQLEASTSKNFDNQQAALADLRQDMEARFQRLEDRIISQHNETLQLIKGLQKEKTDRRILGDLLVELGKSVKK
jgi:regulator of sigma D